MLRTLSWIDFVNVISFDSEVKIAAAHLVPATDENKEALNAWIDQIEDGGTTNFRDSLRLAFNMIADSRQEDRLSCWR